MSALGHWLDRLSTAGLALSGGTLLLNLLTFRHPRGDLPADPPRVSILVPARNEIDNIERCVRSLLVQEYPSFEVIVLDDRSTDGTAERVAALMDSSERLHLLNGQPLPPGWSGKNWACHQLAEAADVQSRWLLFCDADTTHDPTVLQRAIAEAERDSLALLSLMPRQAVESLVERWVVSLLPLQIIGHLPLRLAERLPHPALAAANGQFMLMRSDLYTKSGGHAAAAAFLVDDVRLAQQFKRHGGRVRLANGAKLVSCRMYRTSAEVLTGFRRNYANGFRLSRAVSLLVFSWTTVAWLLPVLRVPFSARARRLVAVGLLLRALLNWRSQLPPDSLLGHAPGVVLLFGIQLASMYDFVRRAPTQWKARDYPSTELRADSS